MTQPEITFYVARADNGVIGRDNGMPFHLPGEQKRFKAMTMGKPMVMGRKTFESFPKALPGRRHIVLTRDAAWAAPGAEVARDVDAAIALAGDVEEIAVIGGAEIFRLFLPRADRIELTEVHLDAEGDTRLDDFGPGWRETRRDMHPADGDKPAHSFVTLVRAGA